MIFGSSEYNALRDRVDKLSEENYILKQRIARLERTIRERNTSVLNEPITPPPAHARYGI